MEPQTKWPVSANNGSSKQEGELTVTELEAMLQAENEEARAREKKRRKLQNLIAKRKNTAQGLPPPVELDEQDLLETARIKSSQISTADTNYLMEPVPVATVPYDEVIAELAGKLIAQRGGLIPNITIKQARDRDNKEISRIVISWEVGEFSMDHLYQIYHACAGSYVRTIRGHTQTGGWERIISYYPFAKKKAPEQRALYFGPESTNAAYFSNTVTGVSISRKFKSATHAKYLIQDHPEDWIMYGSGNWLIEIREGDYTLSQDRLLHLIVQIGVILKHRAMVPRVILMTDIFRELNKVGVTPITRESLYGMLDVLSQIEQSLIYPLQRPDIAETYQFAPESVLLAGVMGVGKTLLTRYFMQGEQNSIFVALEPALLRSQLLADKAAQALLQIDRIRAETRLPVVIMIDDIDQVVSNSDAALKMIALLQGIRQRGFYVLATTNYPEKIDIRLLQPGRLWPVINVPLPNRADRKGVLLTYFAKSPFASEDERRRLADLFSQKTEGWTQRYIADLCDEARRISARASTMSKQQYPANVQPLIYEDLAQAYELVGRRFDTEQLKKWEKKIQEFIVKKDMFPLPLGQYL